MRISANNTVSLAQADSDINAEVVGIVKARDGGGPTTTVVVSGYLSGFTGLTAGEVFFLSDTVPGGFVLTAPSPGISKPVLHAISPTEAVVLQMRGLTLSGGGGGGVALTPFAFRNTLIGSDFDVNMFQRGLIITSPPVAGVTFFVADRWRAVSIGAALTRTERRIPSQDSLPLLGNDTFALKFTGNTGITKTSLIQRVESVFASRLKDQASAKLSFYILNNSGADFNPTVSVNSADVKDEFAAVTSRVNSAAVSGPAVDGIWSRLDITLTPSSLTDLENGFEIIIEIPGAGLDNVTKDV